MSLSRIIKEAAYSGNMGFEEMMKFYNVATDEQVEEMERLIHINKYKAAWLYVQSVIDVKLVGDEFQK